MIVIEEIHVNEALRIIQTFHQVKNGMEVYEKYIEDLKQSIIKMKDKVDLLIKSKEPDLKKQADLFELIKNHEIEINSESKKIEPMLKEIDQLKSDSFKLYHLLKDKYPGSTDVQLKEALDLKVNTILKANPTMLK